jgi:hypothetical protein
LIDEIVWRTGARCSTCIDGGSLEGYNQPGKGHATLTVDFVDTPGDPTDAERDRIVRFFREQALITLVQPLAP